MVGVRGKPASPVQQGIVLGLAFFAAYLLTRTRDIGGDGATFAAAVDGMLAGNGIAREVFHPHHPLFNPIVGGVTWIVRQLGFHPLVADVGAGVAAFFAAVVVAGLVPLLRGAGVPEGAALLAAAITGASGGLWQYATCMEVYALAAAAVLLWLAVLGRREPRPLAAGAALATCVLGHLAAGLLVVPTAVRLRKRPRAVLVACGAGLAMGAVALIAIFAAFHRAFAPEDWLRLVRPRYTGEYLGAPGSGPPWQALVSLCLWRWYAGVPVFARSVSRWLDMTGTAATAILLVMAVAGVVVAVRDRHPLAVTAGLGVAAYVPLWVLWDVGNVEHAVASVPLFATLLAFGCTAFPRRLAAVLLGTALAALLLVNGLASALPQSRPENGREWVIASFVRGQVPKEAVVLSVGMDPRLRLALPYLAGRRVVMLTLDVDSARNQGRPALDGLAYWLRAGSQAPAVWLTPDVLDPTSARWVEKMGIPPGVWSRVVRAVTPVERQVLEPDGIVVREPFVLTRVTLAR